MRVDLCQRSSQRAVSHGRDLMVSQGKDSSPRAVEENLSDETTKTPMSCLPALLVGRRED